MALVPKGRGPRPRGKAGKQGTPSGSSAKPTPETPPEPTPEVAPVPESAPVEEAPVGIDLSFDMVDAPKLGSFDPFTPTHLDPFTLWPPIQGPRNRRRPDLGSKTDSPNSDISTETKQKRTWLQKLGILAGIALGGVGAKSAYDYFTDDEVGDYRDSQMMALLSGAYDNAIDRGGEAGYLGDLESSMRTALRHQPLGARTPRPRPTASSELSGLLTEADIMRLASLRQKQIRTREQILAELGVY